MCWSSQGAFQALFPVSYYAGQGSQRRHAASGPLLLKLVLDRCWVGWGWAAQDGKRCDEKVEGGEPERIAGTKRKNEEKSFRSSIHFWTRICTN